MIVVAGGTGRLGRALVPRLLSEDQDVRVLARGLSGEAPPGVELVRGDIRSASDVTRALDGADVVVSAVQGFAGPGRVTPRSVDREGNLRLVEAAAARRADVVLVSLTHAAPDSPLEIGREKFAAEEALRASGTPWTVVRAAAFAELWIELLEQTAARSHRPLVFGRGRTPLWWVSVDDVASAVARAVLDTSQRGRTFEVVGPQGLSLRELALLVMGAHGWPGTPRRIPRAALRVGSATVGTVVPRVGRQLRAALAMDALPPERADAQADGSVRRSVEEMLRSAGTTASPPRAEPSGR